MTGTEKPKRRFAPVPIETVVKTNRKQPSQPQDQRSEAPPARPAPELTPEPSPRSTSPVFIEQQGRRRFAPQLIETSRRSRRAGDPGPATKPADKTDITPGTRHIYITKPKSRRKQDGKLAIIEEGESPPAPPTRRETEEEGVTEYFLDLASKEAELVMAAAYPNYRSKGDGGVAHFYTRESSGSDQSPESPAITQEQEHAPLRRMSSEDNLNWWQQHMQRHVQAARQKLDEDIGEERIGIDRDVGQVTDAELDKMDISAPPDPLWTTSARREPADREDPAVDVAIAGRGRPRPRPGSPSAAIPPAAAFLSQGPFSKAFGEVGAQLGDRRAQLLRNAASPPMLGRDLVFRQCPSPKWTKLEPDHRFSDREQLDKNRDMTGKNGLWNGFCFKDGTKQDVASPFNPRGPVMMATPFPPSSPGELVDPEELGDASEETKTHDSNHLSAPTLWGSTVEKANQAKNREFLQDIDDRLNQQNLEAEKDEKIAQEFGDDFVTQVYNYLSLGYPAMARAFDEELAKISRMDIIELGEDDKTQTARGHIAVVSEQEVSKEKQCPRWRALRIYINEWARQHPDLDNLDPLAWGVRERRGSWAI